MPRIIKCKIYTDDGEEVFAGDTVLINGETRAIAYFDADGRIRFSDWHLADFIWSVEKID